MITRRRANIFEAIAVGGATFIGNDRNFDLFRIETWEAAQQFVTLGGSAAGVAYTQNEATFNTNIRSADGQSPYELYFFVEENTNRVQTAVLHTNRNPREYTLKVKDTDIEFNVNGFFLEDHNREANVLHSQYIIPLYILPFLTTDSNGSYIHENSGLYSKGIYIKDGKLLGVLGWTTPVTTINEFVAPEEVIDVSDDACKYKVNIHEFKISMNDRSYNNLIRISTGIRGIDNMHYIYPDQTTFIVGSGPVPPLPKIKRDDNTDNIMTPDTDDINTDTTILPGAVPSPEKKQKGRKYSYISANGNVTIYKKENDGIHIVKIPDIRENRVYNIPPEIENIKVVSVDEFAAFGNSHMEYVSVDRNNSLKNVGRNAFAYCPNLHLNGKYPFYGNFNIHPSAFKREPTTPKKEMGEGYNKELVESRADDEYDRKYSSIERDIFNDIVKIDPKTRLSGGEPVDIGFGAKGLLLPAYLKGDNSFLEDINKTKELLNTYYANQNSYPAYFRNIANFSSIEAFEQFVNNPEENTPSEVDPEQDTSSPTPVDTTSIDYIYGKNYIDIPKGIFKDILDMDPTSTESKIGKYAKNLLLPKYKAGETEFINSAKKVKKAIENFIKDSPTYPPDKREFQNFKSVQEFIDFTNSGPESEYALNLKNNDAINPDTNRPIASEIKFIASTSQYEILQPLTAYANAAIVGGGAGGWGNNDIMHWCTADTTMSYWHSYTVSSNCDIFCFMHKTKNKGNENRNKNWQIAIKRGAKPSVFDFRSGEDKPSNDYEEAFFKFLFSQPDICEAIANKEPFSRMSTVQKASSSLKVLEDGLIISKNSDFEKVIALRPHREGEEPLGIKEVTIKNVKEIPANIFTGMRLLSKVTFDTGLEIIGAQAFKDCVNLNGIRFPESLRVIGHEAFMGCTSLANNVNIPNSTEEIKGGAFMGCRCTLTVEKKREQLGLPLKLDKNDEEWYIKHLRGINS